ncbi:polysaccharide deacetylase family protein [Spiribacter onubensis]|uniref:Polysaccharide deacetylase family protein n=1 Tax=Spiribacter onubensis TaxID=3122420 RepID=A0ABV3S9B1_9GAMM
MSRAAVHLSIHDVMPDTLPQVEALIELCHDCGWPPPVLLVVPGAGWDHDGIETLRRWQDDGHELAGHGWRHRITRYGGLWHRLHGAFISRDVAEHLALDAEGILTLMRDCHDWFGARGLASPTLYVPPAWALGAVPRARLDEQPFDSIETMRGIYSVTSGRWRYRALLGYEAGNGLQYRALQVSNAVNRARAPRAGVRIGLHPRDAQLPLAGAMRRDLVRFSPRPPAGGSPRPS